MMSRKAWIAAVIFALAAMCVSAVAQEREQGPKVVGIEVEGNRNASKTLILSLSAIRIGEALASQQVQETIKRLYALDIFASVKIEAEPQTGGATIYIHVTELPKLTKIEFKGLDKVSEKDLKEKLGLAVGGYISPNLAHNAKQKILGIYAEKGYFRAIVTSTLVYTADSTEASILFDVKERSKVKVEQVILTGNSRVPAEDIIKKMRNRKRGFLKSSDFAQDKYEEDKTKIIDEYHKRGFIDAYLISDSSTIDSTINRMTIYLSVYEGPMYYFGKATFSGNSEIKTPLLEKTLKFEEGAIFDESQYDESIGELYSAYQEIGHIHVRILDTRVTQSDSILDISYEISEGLPAKIRFVNIVGNHKTKDKIIRREISSLPGQTFNRSLLIRSVRDVMALNFFAKAEPDPVILPNGDVDVDFKMEEKQTGQVSAGAGYNSQDKLVGNAGIGIPNFRGMGQNVNFSIDFGGRRNSLSVSFTEPWLMGRPTLLGADLYTTNRKWFEDYTERRQGGSVRLGRRLRWPDNYFRVLGSYRLERNKYTDFSSSYKLQNALKQNHIFKFDELVYDTNTATYDTIPRNYVSSTDTTNPYTPYSGSILESEGDWRASSQISLSVIRDSRNLPEFATKGSEVSYSIEVTGGPLGGYWKSIRQNFSIAKFIPLWKFALASRIQYGAISAPSGDSRITLSDRFTPGGTSFDGIVRGYEDGTLTPDSTVTLKDSVYYNFDSLDYRYWVDSAKFPAPDLDSTINNSFTTRVRGKYMLIGNFELQFPVVERQIYMLAFFDAGNSWLNREDINLKNGLFSGAGIGFRIVIPGMGTLGFDYAYPFQNRKNAGQKWKPHFQVGTTFR
jgi:outer membrane protein insertion porin family